LTRPFDRLDITLPATKKLQGLNPQQRKAVSTLAGPLLVLAGAGTGKTRVVTYRIARLIGQGVRPERILAVTFTNKAAREMQQRAAQLLDRRQKEKPEISTFHSLCVRILRRHIQRLGYPSRFVIYDRSDQEAAARTALRELKAPSQTLRPGDLLYLIGRWKNLSVTQPQAERRAESDREHLAAIAYQRYQAALQASGAVDFDDLLLLSEQLLQKFDDVRRKEAGRFEHILIDEYQDTNGSQYRIVKSLAGQHRNLCVVGDDDQSIYGWRGAEVRHILRFKIDWPDAEIVRLETNYRSRPEILAMANRLIVFNQKRHDKQLRPARPRGRPPRILQLQDETEEARTIVKDIVGVLDHTATQPKHIAILFRTNEQPRCFETVLRQAGLPYVLVGGMSFYDRREVRDLIAYLKVITSPQDEASLLRILNTPPRGISNAARTALIEAATQEGKTAYELLPVANRLDGVSAKAANAMQQFAQFIEDYAKRFARQKDLLEVAKQLLIDLAYLEELKRRYPEGAECEIRTGAVEQLLNALGSYQQENRKSSLQGFLDVTLIDQRDDDNNQDRNAIVLMTLHAAKGLEFPHVYLAGLEEGLLPHHRSLADASETAIDEERRLCYVGVTRAQDRLTLSLCLSRRKWGKQRETIPSRFLYELTGQADHPNARNARLGRPSKRKRSPASGS
jgi:DNA helicase-2/ATP-dependent DNA helicase PcrA